ARSSYRDKQMELASAGYDARDAGEEPTEQQQAAMTQRQIVTSADPSFVIADQAFHQIGDDGTKDAYDDYNKIVYSPHELEGTFPFFDRVTGTWYTRDTLIQLSEDERRVVAGHYIDQYLDGGMERLERHRAEREAFLEQHPEYSDFKEYEKGVYQAGERDFRTRLAETNPNFARAMEEERTRLQGNGKQGEVLEKELDAWATKKQAFQAAMGDKVKLSDAEPLPVYDPTAD